LKFEREKPLPLQYKAVRLDVGYRLDLVVESLIVVELKTVDRLAPIHSAQLLTYLRLAKLPLGLLINFNVAILAQGVKRIAN
jgi:GxxExxY protein